MSKKYYEALAAALKTNRPMEHWSLGEKVQWHLDVAAVLGVCQRFNSKFQAEKFIVACGGLFPREAEPQLTKEQWDQAWADKVRQMINDGV